MPSRVWVVIPTYNEAENIEGIVRAALAELERVAPDAHRILIVDDNSPDGTGAIADRLAAAQPQVEVLHRATKTGLGHAYLAGFAHALSGGAELVIEMDADFSHDPRYLGPLLAAAEDADLVLGSRYVEGGGVEDWGLLRRLISRGGGLYARIDPRRPGPRPHRRLQMHPPAGARGDPARDDPGRGVRFPDRGHLPGIAGGVPRRGNPYRFPGPQRRFEQDVGTDRSRGHVGRALPAPPRRPLRMRKRLSGGAIGRPKAGNGDARYMNIVSASSLTKCQH